MGESNTGNKLKVLEQGSHTTIVDTKEKGDGNIIKTTNPVLTMNKEQNPESNFYFEKNLSKSENDKSRPTSEVSEKGQLKDKPKEKNFSIENIESQNRDMTKENYE